MLVARGRMLQKVQHVEQMILHGGLGQGEVENNGVSIYVVGKSRMNFGQENDQFKVLLNDALLTHEFHVILGPIHLNNRCQIVCDLSTDNDSAEEIQVLCVVRIDKRSQRNLIFQPVEGLSLWVNQDGNFLRLKKDQSVVDQVRLGR